LYANVKRIVPSQFKSLGCPVTGESQSRMLHAPYPAATQLARNTRAIVLV
jgi:hypothetical protein